MKRGIVTSPSKFEFNNGVAIVSIGNQLTPADINYYTLYWDELVVLDSENISQSIPKQQELFQNGILQRPRMVVDGMLDISKFPMLYTNFQVQVLNYLRENDKSTDWLLHQTGEDFNFGDYQSRIDNLRLDLLNILPVPGGEVNIGDILEHKYKFKSDFDALHAYIEELYFDILKSPDVELAKRGTFERLKGQVEAIDKICNEKWKIPYKFDISTNLEMDPNQIIDFFKNSIITLTAANLTAADTTTNMIGLAATTALTMVKIKLVHTGLTAGEKNKLAYLAKASQEGILESRR